MSQFNFYAFTNNFEDFKLPDRNAPQYIEIEEFRDNELSNNVANELASRNEDVQNELEKFITYNAQLEDAIIQYRSSGSSEQFQFESFNYKNFFEYGFDEFAIRYLWFRTEAKNYEDTKDYGHNELYKFCKSYIDSFGYEFDDSPYVTLLKKYIMVEDYLNHDFFQRISSKYIEKDGEVYNVNPFDGTYYDEDSDNPYNLTESSKDNYIFKKGLYIYKDDIFKREPLPLWHKSYDEIMPTVSLNYSRPFMKNPYMNKHIYTQLNFNLEEEEILSNVKRMIKINNSQDDNSLKQKILNASDLFFEEYKSYEKPKKLKKNELKVYYADMLYAYDTMKLFEEYLIELNKKYKKGLEEIKSEKNRLETDGQMREDQRLELEQWQAEKKKKKIIHDKIYTVLFDKEFAPEGSHQVNTLLGLVKELIEDKKYRFLI